ncbi:ABC1 kinase family protein [Desulfurispira natronophila]|uniref:Putative unusual protein kinase regulating ubiquinone biosynthesis (AarF/ABC1/UbiB family) n=1 Tax=Desulfurispira natronophila TaxID=682562 RepID=A0A7W7Y272_9BACT|nr:AarF/UbiB family protein [Desulfurispira natronophila]MBB5020708.1 putative unusual protein kinase regulating ubiquinone biosynthesis (AarF/ABC1/UbiB family) [Desulfurispira natronophila]
MPKKLKLMFRLYQPLRLLLVFRFLLTIFLLIKKQPRFIGIPPLNPTGLLNAIQQLGTSFIKLSQVLATRSDFFDTDYLEQLRKLHDKVPQMSAADLDAVYSRAFGEYDPFATFNREAVASASIGQVHYATLKDSGAEVAVKMLRNDIGFVVRQDIRILEFFHRLFRPLFSTYTRNSIESVLQAFAQMILQEVDMAKEREHLEKFQTTYAYTNIRFPSVYANISSPDALVMSYEYGFRFDDREQLMHLDISFEALMEKLVMFYVEQMLVKGYFHADPHPGNLLVNEAGELILLDFGMVTRIPRKIRIATINLVKAAYDRNYEALVSAARKLGIVTEEAPPDELQDLAEQIFDIFDDNSLSASSMQQLATDLLTSMKSMPFKVPQETIYIMRVSAIVEGMGTTYINNFNGIKDILPILRQNLSRALEKENIVSKLVSEGKQLPLTVLKIQKIVDQMHEGDFTVRLNREDKLQLMEAIKAYFRQMLIAGALLGVGLYLLASDIPYALPISIGCIVLGIVKIMRLR